MVGVSGGDTDADLAQTFLVSCLVGLLPVGTAWSVLLLVRVVVVGLGVARWVQRAGISLGLGHLLACVRAGRGKRGPAGAARYG